MHASKALAQWLSPQGARLILASITFLLLLLMLLLLLLFPGEAQAPWGQGLYIVLFCPSSQWQAQCLTDSCPINAVQKKGGENKARKRKKGRRERVDKETSSNGKCGIAIGRVTYLNPLKKKKTKLLPLIQPLDPSPNSSSPGKLHWPPSLRQAVYQYRVPLFQKTYLGLQVSIHGCDWHQSPH